MTDSAKRRSLFLCPGFWLAVVALIFVATRVFLISCVLTIDPMGDENYQFSVLQHGFSIFRGTFMPGIAFYLRGFQPLFDVMTIGDARLIMGVTNIVLTLGSAAFVAGILGGWYAVAYLLILTFAFDWSVASVTLWGEYPGSVLLVIQFLYMYWAVARIAAGKPVWLVHYALLALLFAISLYVRQNFMLFPLVVLALSVIVFAVVWFRDRERRFRVFLVPLAYAVGLTALAPWSIALSRHLGGFRVAPISQDVSVAIHYGSDRLIPLVSKIIRDHERAVAEAKGREPKADHLNKTNTFLLVHRAARIRAAEEHRPLVEVYREFREYALEGLTPRRVLGHIQDSWRRFLTLSGNFSERFLTARDWRYKLSKQTRDRMAATHLAVFVGSFALALAVAVIPFWGTLGEQLLVVAYKGVFCFACLHPFVHRTIARQHQFVVPLMVLGALLLFRECRRVVTTSSWPAMAGAEKALFYAQATGGLLVLALAAAIAFWPV